MKKQLSSFLFAASFSFSHLFSTTYTVSVANDNGEGATGTFSAAINALNQSGTSGTIQINTGINPDLTGSIPTVYETVSIVPESGSNTIYFNQLNMDISNGITEIDSNISLNSPSLQISNDSSLYINGNITDLYQISMNGSALEISGNTSINTGSSISIGNGSVSFSEPLTLSGASFVGVYINGENAILNFESGATVSCTSGGCGLTFSVIDGTLNFGNTTNGGAIQFLTQGGTIDLSNNICNSTYGLDVQLLSGTLTLSSANNIENPSGSGSLLLQEGTLNIIGDTTFFEDYVTFTSTSSVNFSVDSGFTLTIPTLQIQPNSSSANASLNFIQDGNVIVEAFNFTPYSTSEQSPYTLTLNGSLSGTNGLTLTNSSNSPFTLILTEVNSFSGATTIGNSYGPVTLQVNSEASFGTNTYPITIESLSTLVDNGIVYASSLTNNGTLTGSGYVYLGSTEYVIVNGSLEPGSSPTTLHIIGNISLNPGSIFAQYIEPGASAKLEVSESLIIESNTSLEINPENGCYARSGEIYEFVNASSISGTFEKVTVNSVLLDYSLTYSGNNISLTITPKPLSSIATTGNPYRVAKAIDSILDSGNANLCNEIGKLIQSTKEEIILSLNQMQPSQFKAFAVSQENNAVKVRDSLSFRFQRELDAMHCSQSTHDSSSCGIKSKPFHLWMTGFGDALHQGTPKYLEPGYQENMGGISSGMDLHFSKIFYAGLLGSYTSSDIRWKSNQGSGTIQSGYAGLYFSALGKIFYGTASILGAWSHYTGSRNINFPSEQFTANNTHGGAQLLSHIDTGLNLGWKGFSIRPFDSFDYISQTENGFRETGAGPLNLTVKKNNSILLRNELGLNFSKCFCIKGSQLTVSPKISWVREVRTKGAQYQVEFTGSEDLLTVTGFFPDRSLVSPGLTIAGNLLNDMLTLELYYNGEFKGNYSDHSYGGQVRFGF